MRKNLPLSTLATLSLLFVPPDAPARSPDVVYVPTPEAVVDTMLEVAEVDAGDVVYDLGCGDGRIVISAARDFGARGVGVDIDPRRIAESEANVRAAGLEDRVEILQADLFTLDLRPATVVTLYLLPELNEKLRPQLFAQLRPGTRVVSHDFAMGDWDPDRVIEMSGEASGHTVYFWVIPANADGTWRLDGGGEIEIDQVYQNGTGTMLLDGEQHVITEAELDGAAITLTAEGPEGRRTFAGTVAGDSLELEERGTGRRLSAHRQSPQPGPHSGFGR